MSVRKILCLLLCWVYLIPAYAGKIDKAFEALKVYNYFEAKKLFESALSKEAAPAHYGLALIYSRNDNPFYNLDSAYSHVIPAEQLYSGQKDKVKQKLKKYDYDYPAIENLRQAISTGFYKIAAEKFTEFSFQSFIMLNPWAQELPKAVHLRDSLAYETSKKSNTSKDYAFFLEKYPESEYAEAAWADFHLKQYQEQTKEQSIQAFVKFMRNYPANPYTGDAQDRIYALATEDNKIHSFYQFTKDFPSNRNVETAWKRVYQLYMYDYSDGRFDQFMKEYPSYPYMAELLLDKKMALQNLLPFRKNNLFGWMNYNGEIVYPAEYETLGFFKEGLSLASKNGKYGYINKGNQVIIPFIYDSGYDFEQGRAIVEIKDKFGIIDRTGKLLFDVEFSDIGTFSEGLIYAAKDSLYGYFDKYGVKRFEKQFSEAFGFVNGKALVETEGKQAVIDTYGEYIFPPVYEEIALYNDNLLIFEEEEYYGIVDRKGNIILPAEYDRIGKLDNHKAILVKNDLMGYIDDSAKIVIPVMFELYPNFMERANFSGNYAKVKYKGKFGIIDTKGKWVIPASYPNLGEVSTLIAFNKGKVWGFIDLKNKVVLNPSFEYAESFKDGLAVAEKQTLQGLINAQGKWIMQPEHTGVVKLENGFYKTNDGAKLGLYTPKGEKITENTYQIIKILDEDFILLSSPGQVHYYYIPEMKLIKPKFEQ